MRSSASVPAALGGDHRHLSKDEMESVLSSYSGIPSKNDKILTTFFSLDTNVVTKLSGDSYTRSPSKLDSKVYITKNKYGHKVTTYKNKLNTLATMKGIYYEKWRMGSDVGPKITENNFAGNEVEEFDGYNNLHRILSKPKYQLANRNNVKLDQLNAPFVGSMLNSLNKLTDTMSPQSTFVLVESSKLAEVMEFEKQLKYEKTLIGDKAAWLLDDFAVELYIPSLATKKSVHAACDNVMKKYSSEILVLTKEWDEFCKKNHYNKPHLYLKETFVDIAPAEHKTLKLKLVREAAESWRLRKDQDTMVYEDNFGYLYRNYLEIKSRMLDYDRYFVLATRYGSMTSVEFSLDSRPGLRYYVKVTDAALKFQRIWDRYWGLIKVRRHVAARNIQKAFRCHSIFSKLYPIIKLRKKFGKRTYYIYAFAMWKQYNRLVKIIRESIKFYRQNRVKDCYAAWKGWVKQKSDRKALVLQKFVMRFKNMGLARCYLAWANYANYTKQLKRRVRRLLSCPHFDMWLDYVERAKAAKVKTKAVVPIQSVIRMWLRTKKYRKMKKSCNRIRIWWRIHHLVRTKRFLLIQRDYEVWKPIESEKRVENKIDYERRRIIRFGQYYKERESKALINLKKFLTTSAGKLQKSELAREIRHQSRVQLLTTSGSLKMAETELLTACKRVTRSIETRNFDTKNVPFCYCPDTSCTHISPSFPLFVEHFMAKHAKDPAVQPPDDFIDFFKLARHSNGSELLRSYLCKVYGFCQITNCIDFWLQLQIWKKLPTTVDAYHITAMNIYEWYLRSDSDQYIGGDELVNASEWETITSHCDIAKNREYEGLFRITRAKRPWWRRLLGIKGKPYKMWSETNMVIPSLFNHLEWSALKVAFRGLQSNKQHFLGSPEYSQWQKVQATDDINTEKLLFDDFKKHRYQMFIEAARDYKIECNQILLTASEVADKILDDVVNYFLHGSICYVANEDIFKISYAEQEVHERLNSYIDEALYWSEDNIIDTFYDFYCKEMLICMWANPNCQQGMLEYIGKYQGGLKKHLVIDVTKTVDYSWFPPFFEEAVQREKQLLPLDPIVAITRIQVRARGMLGRNKARRQFSTIYRKKYDPESKMCFYVLLNTEPPTVTWDRPMIINKLFPRSNW